MEDKQRLFRLIKSVNRSGAFNGAGPAEAALTHLEVTGVPAAESAPAASSVRWGCSGLTGSDPAAPFPALAQDRERRIDGNAPIMDLEGAEGDDELLGGEGPAGDGASLMQVSPPSLSRQPSRAGVAPPAPDLSAMPKIRVIVRKRPLNSREMERGEEDVVHVSSSSAELTVNETKVRVDLTKYVERHHFKFDCTLGEDVDNEQVYAATVQPLVATLFHQGRSTVFAYGWVVRHEGAGPRRHALGGGSNAGGATVASPPHRPQADGVGQDVHHAAAPPAGGTRHPDAAGRGGRGHPPPLPLGVVL